MLSFISVKMTLNQNVFERELQHFFHKNTLTNCVCFNIQMEMRLFLLSFEDLLLCCFFFLLLAFCFIVCWLCGALSRCKTRVGLSLSFFLCTFFVHVCYARSFFQGYQFPDNNKIAENQQYSQQFVLLLFISFFKLPAPSLFGCLFCFSEHLASFSGDTLRNLFSIGLARQLAGLFIFAQLLLQLFLFGLHCHERHFLQFFELSCA